MHTRAIRRTANCVIVHPNLKQLPFLSPPEAATPAGGAPHAGREPPPEVLLIAQELLIESAAVHLNRPRAWNEVVDVHAGWAGHGLHHHHRKENCNPHCKVVRHVHPLVSETQLAH